MSRRRLASRVRTVALALVLAAGSVACALVAGLEDKEAYEADPLEAGAGSEAAAVLDTGVTDAALPPQESGPIGVSETIAMGQAKPWGVAVDDAFVYWTNEGDNTIKRAPKSGGTAVVIARDQLEPHRILVDPTAVFWHNTNLANRPYVDGSADFLEIVELPKASIGTDAGPLKIESTRTVSRLRDLAISKAPDNEIWTSWDSKITRYRRDSSVGQRNVQQGLLPQRPTAVAVDDVNVYWFLQQPFELWRNSKEFDDGGADASVLIGTLPGSPEIADMVTDGTAIYMVSSGGTLLKVPIATGTAMQLGAGQPFPKAIAQDDKYVYFTRSDGDDAPGKGVVMMVAKAGNETKIVANGQDKPRGLVLDVAGDGAHVLYWANYGDGTIRRETVR